MISVQVRGSFANVLSFGERMLRQAQLAPLAAYGPIGVAALKAATPSDSEQTAEGWYYEIVSRPGYYSLQWLNSHTVEPGHIPVAVLIQYGHGTRQGAYVQGRDFINPAMAPIFDQIAADMWKEVTR